MDFVKIPWQSPLFEQELALRDQLLRRPLGLTFSPEQLAGEKDQIHWGLVEGEALVACVVVVPLDSERVKLRQMAVDEAWQGQGCGRLLIENTESWLKSRQVKHIELHAREPVTGFYESLGYRPEGERFMEVTIWHQKMVKAFT